MPNKQKLVSAFFEYVGSIRPVPDDARVAAEKRLFRRMLKAGRHALREGEIENHVRFVASGIVRQYYVKNEREFNKEIYLAPAFVSSFASLLTRAPSEYRIQAMRDSEMLVLDLRSLDELYADFPYWEHIGRKVAEQKYLLKEKREAMLLVENAEERYEWLLREKPELLQHINLYELASYLGLTRETLSRIRRQRADTTRSSHVQGLKI